MAEVPKQLTPFDSERARAAGKVGGANKKGKLHLSTHIQNMLEDENFEQKLKNGTVLKGRPLEAILKVAIAKARTGDIRFLEWLAKYGWSSKIDLTSGGEPLNVIVEGVYARKPNFRPDNASTETDELAEDSNGESGSV